ncbi:MAG: T9SS type A sorting domain-containing protein [Flavobacteriales bacterium]|nr:T9SS type A sorting domain-containing protein [Flavobacteriales bacterium]
MKKIYSLVATAVFATSAMVAQNVEKVDFSGKIQILNTQEISKSATPKVATDTAGWMTGTSFAPEFAGISGQVTEFGYSGGGFIFGNNVGGLNKHAQGYFNEDELNFSIDEVLMLAVGKDNNDVTSFGTVTVYSMADNKAANDDGNGGAALNSPGPNATLGSGTILLSAMDTTWFPQFSVVTLTSPANVVGTDFAVAFDAADIDSKQDTVGLLGDSNGDGYSYCFHFYNGNWWVTDFLFGGPGVLDANSAIFPVIGDQNVGIEANGYLNGLKMSAYPNPAADVVNINYGIENSSDNVEIKIIDATGRIIEVINSGSKLQGEYVETINLNSYAAGKYFYTVTTNAGSLTKKFVVTK